MKTVIEMAKEAGFMVVHEGEPEIGAWYECFTEQIERFAELVRAEEREKFCSVLRQLHDSYSLLSDPSSLRNRSNT